MSVRDTDRGYRRAIRELLRMSRGMHVVAGIRGEAGAHREPPEEGETGEPITLVEIGAIQEFGTRNGRIPSRSYMRSTFDEKRDRYVRQLGQALPRIVDGSSTLEAELEALGVRVAGDIQRKIGVLRDPPLAQMTIDRKGSSKPLIDTGRLRQSIDSEVRGGSS